MKYMDKFKQIFSGLTIAYGQYQPGDRGENGTKQKGKAFIVRKDRYRRTLDQSSWRKRTRPWDYPYHRK